MEVVIVATVSTDSAVFVATRPVYPSICVDIVLAYLQQKSHLWKVSPLAGYLAWMKSGVLRDKFLCIFCQLFLS